MLGYFFCCCKVVSAKFQQYGRSILKTQVLSNLCRFQNYVYSVDGFLRLLCLSYLALYIEAFQLKYTNTEFLMKLKWFVVQIYLKHWDLKALCVEKSTVCVLDLPLVLRIKRHLSISRCVTTTKEKPWRNRKAISAVGGI